MLAALLVAFLGFMVFVGPGGDQFGELMTQHVKGQIKVTIADEDRRETALKGLSVVNDDISDLNEQLSKDAKALEKLIRNYDSKPEDFDRLFASVLAKRERQVDKLWDDRQAMLIHIQPDEWRAIISGARAELEKEAAKKTEK
jgi:hypothetical protein